MRYALIIAGGSGTRLWPMSTKALPKQLIPFIDGRSLLQIAMERLAGLLPEDRVYVCAGQAHKDVMLERLPGLSEDRFIAEPTGRDTLNAVGLGTGVIAARCPQGPEQATVAVFTADHLIEPVDRFQRIVERGYAVAEASPDTLVTFGIAPTEAATGYGYLQLGQPLPDAAEATGSDADLDDPAPPRIVSEFKEKPARDLAEQYVAAGPAQSLWPSGMFVWNAAPLDRCIARFAPENHAGLRAITDAVGTPGFDTTLGRVFPELKKISVDYAVMEPASRDDDFNVAAVPMPLSWLDVGSWPAYAQTLTPREAGNRVTGCRSVRLDANNCLIASDDPDHVVATLGVDDLIVIHTARATLICRKDRAQDIKAVHQAVGEQCGKDYL